MRYTDCCRVRNSLSSLWLAEGMWWVMARSKNSLSRILIIPDTHVPYHDERAWRLLLQVAQAFGFDYVIILGDFRDCYSVSAHSKSPSRVRLVRLEADAAKKKLDELGVALKVGRLKHYHLLTQIEKLYDEGNHETRIERQILERVEGLEDVINTPKLLGLRERGWRFTPYRKHAKVGKLYSTHDVGQNGALKVLNTFQSNVISGHDHAINYCVRGNATGEAHVSSTFGWLGDRDKVDYMHKIKAYRDWALGFGIGYLGPNDYIYLVPVPIVDYTCVVEGRLFTQEQLKSDPYEPFMNPRFLEEHLRKTGAI